MEITRLDSNPVPVEYTEEEMREKVLHYIDEVKEEFSFKVLSSYIINMAKKEQKVKDADHTQYSSSNEMNSTSSILLSKILWELIWDKKIFIAFGVNPYSTHYTGDTRFGIVNK